MMKILMSIQDKFVLHSRLSAIKDKIRCGNRIKKRVKSKSRESQTK